MRLFAVALAFLALAHGGIAADHPSAPFANELIEARVYLPDPENGYYRGTRFDWSGAIYSLQFAGHQYFGEWQQSDDPYLHDRITGPVEEYRTANKGLGYDDGQARFLRIGVGVVEKPDEDDYRWTHSYKVVDPGEWTIRRGANWIEFTHDIAEPTLGYGYRLTKRLTLTPGKPELVIDHTLENSGAKTIETSVYNHNFFVIDNQPTGPDFTVTFPFELTAGEFLTLSLWDFRDVRGEVINAGGFWRTKAPTAVRLVQLQLDDESPLIGLIAIRAGDED